MSAKSPITRGVATLASGAMFFALAWVIGDDSPFLWFSGPTLAFAGFFAVLGGANLLIRGLIARRKRRQLP